MGEARRRRIQQSLTIGYRDIKTGELRTARNAGDPDEFLRRLRAVKEADDRGERPTATVACNGCTACCYYKQVDFDPNLERKEDLAHLDFIAGDAPGRARLRKREDGACIHLGDEGCSVYGHRPRPCRMYDCRTFALVSMVDTFDGDRHSPVWIFDARDQKSRILKEGFRFLGLAGHAQAQKSGDDATAEATLRYAMAHIGQWCEAMEELTKLSPDQLAKTLGFDPRSMTEEDMRDTMKAMTSGMRTV